MSKTAKSLRDQDALQLAEREAHAAHKEADRLQVEKEKHVQGRTVASANDRRYAPERWEADRRRLEAAYQEAAKREQAARGRVERLSRPLREKAERSQKREAARRVRALIEPWRYLAGRHLRWRGKEYRVGQELDVEGLSPELIEARVAQGVLVRQPRGGTA